MTPTATKKIRRKRCSECGELKDDVLGRQRLCADCEQDKSYCKVCDEFDDRAWGGTCRHVQWDNAGGYECGCGTWSIEAESHKESFVALLSKLAPMQDYFGEEPLVPAMLRFIRANNFWTFWHGPLIGYPPSLEFRYEKQFPKHKSILTLADIAPSVQESWGDLDELQLGMSWLTSLDSETNEANKVTASWIKEFLSLNRPQ